MYINVYVIIGLCALFKQINEEDILTYLNLLAYKLICPSINAPNNDVSSQVISINNIYQGT